MTTSNINHHDLITPKGFREHLRFRFAPLLEDDDRVTRDFAEDLCEMLIEAHDEGGIESARTRLREIRSFLAYKGSA